jgi:MarR family 2-MHQ and catechol resistance regulon transcriptional repressor
VDRLEADGLVERKDCPEDRRSVLAVITDKGRSRYEEGDRALTEIVEELLKPFSDDERGLIISLLGRLENR